mmetsp:Transcript_1732/g.4894  ORF Transcript_1732/g.4894 Transcript_1732/m.4894 type:complete len:248 (+) Transcript_1732:567-1310(+)
MAAWPSSSEWSRARWTTWLAVRCTASVEMSGSRRWRMALRRLGWPCSKRCWTTKFPYWWRPRASASTTIWSSSGPISVSEQCSIRRSNTRHPKRCLATVVAPFSQRRRVIGLRAAAGIISIIFVSTWLPWRDSYSSTVLGSSSATRRSRPAPPAASRAFWMTRVPQRESASGIAAGSIHWMIRFFSQRPAPSSLATSSLHFSWSSTNLAGAPRSSSGPCGESGASLDLPESSRWLSGWAAASTGSSS